jgi:MFS family permease
MSLGFGVVQLDVTIVNTAINSIGTSLGGGVSELQWVVTTYTIAFAALILTAGALGDRVGAKTIFMAGFAIFTAASLACAWTRPAQGSPPGFSIQRDKPAACSVLLCLDRWLAKRTGSSRAFGYRSLFPRYFC